MLPPELVLRRDVSARGELPRPSCRFVETRLKTRFSAVDFDLAVQEFVQEFKPNAGRN